MTLQRLLQTFDPLNVASEKNASTTLTSTDLEHLRTQAFEKGYASGWEDATSSADESRMRVSAELERNIQNLAFTYNEAVEQIRGELRDFIETLIDCFFPELVPVLLREHVRNELVGIADDIAGGPLEIVTSPDCTEVLSEMLETEFAMQINLVTDSNLAGRQAFVRIASREVEIDFSPLLRALREQWNAMQVIEKVVESGR